MDISWHCLTPQAALGELQTDQGGLSAAEAAARLQRYGPNRLPQAARVSALTVLRSQLTNLVTALLLAAALVSVLLGEVLEASAIFAVLALNIALGFVVELRARRAMEALTELEVPLALVLRSGRISELPAHEVVPGDVIELVAGERIPADARLLRAFELRINESTLTGEAFPAEKSADGLLPAEVPLAERSNLVLCGTTAVSGGGRAVVFATGSQTEIGRIGQMVAAIPDEKTPLERKLDGLGSRLALVTLAIAALVFAVGWLRGYPPGELLVTSIALAIAAVPEGLPVVATVTLAIGLRRMARRNALVRRLHAVEALGSVTVVCTDKTGTLTTGMMSVTDLWVPDERVRCTHDQGRLQLRGSSSTSDYANDVRCRALLRAGALSARVEVPSADPLSAVGDPIDVALLTVAAEAGFERADLLRELPVQEEIPFSAARRFTASFHLADPGVLHAFVKGAPETVIARCGTQQDVTGVRRLDNEARERALAANERMAADGLRVIALASAEGVTPSPEALNQLTLLGLVGISDPIAPGVADTIERLRAAGIRVLMLTGDQRLTAAAVASTLGLAQDQAAVLDAREMQQLADPELVEKLGRTAAFSRITAAEKLRIVELLQRQGDIVAMLGDGVNDAAALKKADVGVAMGGRGAHAARETALVVLQDDRFATIAVAVEQGRVIFDNIRRFIFYLFSCNFAEILVILCATIAGWPLPLLPLQLLWLNLITDTFPAFALAFEPGEPDTMQRQPRPPAAALLSGRFTTLVVAYAALMATATLSVVFWSYSRGDSPVLVATCGFLTIAFVQITHVGNARSRFAVLAPRRALANRYALAAVALVVVLQVGAVTWPPLVRVLGTTTPSLDAWLVIVLAAASVGVAGQIIKLLGARRRMTRQPSRSALADL